MTSEPLSSSAESYPEEADGATARLLEAVIRKTVAGGAISFPFYLSLVLYHEEYGYYARNMRRTGREGDFFTSVSVGKVFGQILAAHAEGVWEKLGRPAVFRIVEWGAEDGALARDILESASGDFAQALRYAIVEPLVQKRERLAASWERWSANGPIGAASTEFVGAGQQLSPLPGLIIANELLDALPFWLVRREGGRWLEKAVAWGEDGLAFELREPEGDLRERLEILPEGLPDHYETEVRAEPTELLEAMAGVIEAGEIILPDYGFERAELYHPERVTGTLRTYGRHRAGEDPLETPGQIDITAHVDFTSLREAGERAGLRALPLESQGRFLTKAAAPLLLAMEGKPDPAFTRQFLTLTHPAQLGTKFQVQVFEKSQ